MYGFQFMLCVFETINFSFEKQALMELLKVIGVKNTFVYFSLINQKKIQFSRSWSDWKLLSNQKRLYKLMYSESTHDLYLMYRINSRKILTLLTWRWIVKAAVTAASIVAVRPIITL